MGGTSLVAGALKRRPWLILGVTLTLLASCGGSESTIEVGSEGVEEPTTSLTSSTVAPDEGATGEIAAASLVQVRQTSQGAILETAEGLTLYANAADVVQATPTCAAATDDCSKWIPVVLDINQLPEDLNSADFLLVETPDGFQLSYKRGVDTGLPLYIYGDDEPGQYNGHKDGLGSWNVITEAGKLGNTFDVDIELSGAGVDNDAETDHTKPDDTETETASASDVEADVAQWESFWAAFSAAVQAGNGEIVAALALDPVPIGTSDVEVTRAQLASDLTEYFPDTEAFAIPADQLETREMIEQHSERFNTPVGETIHFLIVELGTHSMAYGFAQLEGEEFQLRSIQILQP